MVDTFQIGMGIQLCCLYIGMGIHLSHWHWVTMMFLVKLTWGCNDAACHIGWYLAWVYNHAVCNIGMEIRCCLSNGYTDTMIPPMT